MSVNVVGEVSIVKLNTSGRAGDGATVVAEGFLMDGDQARVRVSDDRQRTA